MPRVLPPLPWDALPADKQPSADYKAGWITGVHDAVEVLAKIQGGEAAQILFDFGGFLTSSERQWVFSTRDDAEPMNEAIKLFADQRRSKLD